MKRILSTIFIFCFVITSSFATDYTFNVSNGDWNVAGNWSPNGIPGLGDKAIIDLGRTVNITTATTVDIVELKNSGVIAGTENLTINTNFIWNSGSLNGAGFVLVTGTLTASTNSTHAMGGSKELHISGTASFNDMPMSMSGTAKIIIKPTGSLTWDTPTAKSLSGLAANTFGIENGGVFTKTGVGDLNISATVEFNNGTIHINTGNVIFSSPTATHTFTNGVININVSYKLDLSRSGGAVIYNISGTTFEGMGRLEASSTAIANFESGTAINLSGAIGASLGGIANIKTGVTVTNTPKLIMNGGTINDDIGINAGEVTLENSATYGGTGSPTFSNGFMWKSGTFSGSGTVTVSGTIIGTTNTTHAINGIKELHISGAASFNDIPLSMSGTAKIIVKPSGNLTWDTPTAKSLTGLADNTFGIESGGVFSKTGAGDLSISATIQFNTGTINVNTGNVIFSSPTATHTFTNGVVNINVSYKLDFSRSGGSPVYNIFGTTFAGMGRLEVSQSAIANFETGTAINLSGAIGASVSGIANIKTGVTLTNTPKLIMNGGAINDDIGINAGEVTIENNGTYGGIGNPTFGNGFLWKAGTFSGSGTVTVSGTITGTTNSTHAINGSKELHISGIANFNDIPLSMSGTAKIIIKPTGSLTWDTPTAKSLSGLAANTFGIENGGVFTKTGAGDLSISATIEFNTGIINVNTGNVIFSSPAATHTFANGVINITVNYKLDFSRSGGSPVYNIFGTTFAGMGRLEVSQSATANFETGTAINLFGVIGASVSGIANIKTGVTVINTPKFIMNGGTINDDIGINAGEVTIEGNGTYSGTGSPTFGNGFLWKYGSFSGSGTVTVSGTITGTTNSTHAINGSKELHISGIANFNDIPLSMSGTAKIIIKPLGNLTWDTPTGKNLSGLATNIFGIENGGVFTKTGTGDLSISAAIEFNTGTINVNIGNVIFSSSAAIHTFTNGVININVNYKLDFSRSGGVPIYNISGTTFAGMGRLEVSQSAIVNFETGTAINLSGAIGASTSGIANIKTGVTVTNTPKFIMNGGTINDDIGNSAGEVTIENNGTYGGTGSPTFANGFIWIYGNLTGSGIITATGNITASSANTHNITGSKELHIPGVAAFNNISMTMSGTAKIIVKPTGNLTWDTPTTKSLSGLAANTFGIENGGVFTKTGIGDLSIAAKIEFNSGTIHVNTGNVIFFSPAVTHTFTNGVININTNYKLDLSRSSGTPVYNISGTTFAGMGRLEVSSTAIANILSPLIISTKLVVNAATINDAVGINPGEVTLENGGTYEGTGSPTFANGFIWTYGNLTGSGIITATGSISASTTNTHNISGSKELHISSTANFNDIPISMSGTAKIIVKPTGNLTWDTPTTKSLTGLAANTFGIESGGVFTKTGAGDLNNFVKIEFNTGTIHINTGNVIFSSPAITHTFTNGVININTNYKLDLSRSSGTPVYNISGTTFAGMGRLEVSSTAIANILSPLIISTKLVVNAATINDAVGINPGEVTILNSGTYDGVGSPTFANGFIWTYGNLTGSGIITATGSISASTTNTHNISGSKELHISGTANFNDIPISMSGTAKIIVKPTGNLTWDTPTTKSLTGLAANTFGIESGGVFTKTGAGDLNISVKIEFNTGTIHINTGNVIFSSPAITHTFTNGVININTNYKLDLSRSSGIPVYNISGTTFAGMGRLEVSSTAIANILSPLIISTKLVVNAATINDAVGINPGEVTLLNSGTYDGVGSPTFANGFIWTYGNLTGSGIITASGSITASTTNTHNINGSKELHISGAASFNNITVTMSGTSKLVVKSGGVLTWDTNGDRFLSGTSSNEFLIESGGIFTKTGNSILSILSIVNLTEGTVNVIAGSVNITGSGTSTYTFNNGIVNLNLGTSLILSRSSGTGTYNITGTTFTGSGRLEVSNSAIANFESPILMSTKLIANAGTINDNVGLQPGEVTIDYSGTYGGTGSPTFNNGFIWTYGNLTGSGIIHVTGSMTANSPNSHSIGDSKELHISGAAAFNNITVNMSGTSKMVVKSSGVLTWDSNLGHDLFGTNLNAFIIETGGELSKTGNSYLAFSLPLFNYGKIEGLGSIVFGSSFTNAGIVSPGTSPGLLTLNKYSNNNSTLQIEINGPGAIGVDRDSLKISGTPVTLGGNLEVKLGNGFVPDSAMQFGIVSSPAGYGTFESLTSIGLPSDTMGWKIIYNPTSVFIKYCPLWYPDLDGDGFGDFNSISKFCDCIPAPPNYSRDYTDCDDADVLEKPGQTWYIDADSDGYGVSSVVQCLRPTNGYVIAELSGTGTDDCNDNNPLEKPDQTWYIDADGDDYGTSSVVQCLRPTNGFVIAELSGTGTDDCDDADVLEKPGQTWYIDADGDDFGVSSVVQCLRPTNGYVIAELSGTGTDDCDDSDPLEKPGQTWYIDADGDDYGVSSVVQCLRPTNGYVIAELSGTGTDDCDDADVLEKPGQTWYIDADGDDYGVSSVVQCLRPTNGFVIGELSGIGTDDCNDNNPLEKPGQTWYIDADGDDYGVSSVVQCLRPTNGFVIEELSGIGTDDCDDTDPLEKPGQMWYIDADGDDYGTSSVVQCLRPTNGYVIAELSGTGTDDCNDNNPLEKPDQTWYIDADGDDYGTSSVVQCLRPTNGFVIAELSGTGTDDCDDSDPLEKPGQTWYIDADGDDYGVSSVVQCLRPTNGFVIEELSGIGTDDCDDTDPLEKPGQMWYIDADGDDYGTSSVVQCLRPTNGFVLAELSGTGTDDCDDTDLEVYPNSNIVKTKVGDGFWSGLNNWYCQLPSINTDSIIIDHDINYDLESATFNTGINIRNGSLTIKSGRTLVIGSISMPKCMIIRPNGVLNIEAGGTLIIYGKLSTEYGAILNNFGVVDIKNE